MKIPFIAIKNQIIIPYSKNLETIKIGKQNSINSLNLAIDKYDSTFLATFLKPSNKTITNPSLKDLEEFGVLVYIHTLDNKNGVYTIEVKAANRCKILDIKTSKRGDEEIKLVECQEETLENKGALEFEKKRLVIGDKLKELSNVPNYGIDGPGDDVVFRNIHKNLLENKNLDSTDKYSRESWELISSLRKLFTKDEILNLLNYSDLSTRYDEIIKKLTNKAKFVEFDKEISNNLHEDMEEQQRDFYLREKLRQIRKMLKEDDGGKSADDIEKNEDLKRQYPDYVLQALRAEQTRMSSMMQSSPEANISKTYIELILALPWRKVSKELIDINLVREILDKNHYGLEKAKERILEFISVLTHTKSKNESSEYVSIKGEEDKFIDSNLFVTKAGSTSNKPVNNIPILTLIGPPGTGKTTLAKSIAESLNRKFIKVSLGGVKDESEIRGHRRTYVGAMPGKIISAIKKAGVSNPVILLDEIDKMSSDFRGDPTSAMLEVLDPEQNANFQDHYLDLEYDLSKVLFIATANYYDSIPAALIDRVELLELSTYTIKEKVEIAKSHLMPKIYSQNALTEKQIQISDEILEFIVRFYTRESGVRELKRILDSIARKIVVRILDKKIKDSFVVTKDVVIEFLGPVKFEDDENENKAQVGVVNGLAYTSFGGSTLAIEVTTFPGKEGLRLTGQLKDVMKESAQIALAYVRSNAKKFGIDFDFDNNSIHIHVPAGAIPKDGPSAGVTFTTSIISALSKRPVPANIGMTGEITLRGKVLPIGGLKEKSLAATQFGIKKIFIPHDNFKNLNDVPQEVKKEVTFIPVKYYDEIYDEIFN